MVFNKLFAFGILKGVIKLIGKIIYKIVSFFNLQLTIIICIVGLLLEIAFGTVQKSDTSFLLFHLLIVASIVYAVLKTIYKLVGGDTKSNNERNENSVIVKQQNNDKSENTIQKNNSINNEFKTISEEKEFNQAEAFRQDKPQDKPVYFRAKQNRDYVFAEYSDRYELYKEINNQLIYVRTDYKK